LKDRWGNTPLDDIRDRKVREEVLEHLKRRQFRERRGSLAVVPGKIFGFHHSFKKDKIFQNIAEDENEDDEEAKSNKTG
jgi:hypothetical protein